MAWDHYDTDRIFEDLMATILEIEAGQYIGRGTSSKSTTGSFYMSASHGGTYEKHSLNCVFCKDMH